MKKGTSIILIVGIVMVSFLFIGATVSAIKTRLALKNLYELVDIGSKADIKTATASTSVEDNLTSLIYDFSDFDSIDVSSAIELYVVEGSQWEVKVEVASYYEESVKATQNGKTVKLWMKENPFLFLRKNSEATVFITMPNIRNLETSGATKVEIDGFSLELFDLDISGASKILFKDFSTKKLKIVASGASIINFKDSEKVLTELTLDLSGASKVDLRNYKAKKIDLDVSGATKLKIGVDGSVIIGEASGASKIDIYGLVVSSQIDTSGATNIRYHK